MRIGINCTAPVNLPAVLNLIESGIADFCEIMVDNFAHLSTQTLRDALAGTPVSLHIVASRFLEKSPPALIELGDYLQSWIAAINPIYVSDHLLRYSEAGRRLAFATEIDYVAQAQLVSEKVITWQHLLGCQLFIENYASLTSAGVKQAEFFAKLLSKTRAGLLFDFSNAYIAQHNQILSTDAWLPLLSQAQHFHVGGFKLDKTSQLAIDTHDTLLSNEVIAWIKSFLQSQHTAQTLVIEYDAKFEAEVWRNEILRVRAALGCAS